MAILTNLFGESPFGTLEAHGEKVHQCVGLLNDVFAAVKEGNAARLKELAEKVAALESEADKIRNHLHEQLASKTLLAMKKDELFNMLEQQDSMADRAEDIAWTLTYQDMTLPEGLMTEVLSFVNRVLHNCELAAGVMSKLDLLVEASFTGLDARTVARLINELAEREDALKPHQINLTRNILDPAHQLPPVKAMLWRQVINHLAELSKYADRTGNAVLMSLELKPEKK